MRSVITVIISAFLLIGNSYGQESENIRIKIGVNMAKVIMQSVVTPDEIEDCPCKGTKFITHGDGHRTPCPCGNNCKCKKPQGDIGDIGEPGDIGDLEEIFEEDDKCNCENCDCKDCGCLAGECKCPSKTEASAIEKEKTMPAMTMKQKYDYILYHLGASYCGPCRRLQREVWPNEEDGVANNNDMKEFLSENRIRLILLDEEEDKNKKYFKYYRPYMRPILNKGSSRSDNPSLPTVLMVPSGDVGKPVFVSIGFRNKKSMMYNIQSVLEAQNEQSNAE